MAGYARLYVDDKLVLDAWSANPTATTVTATEETSAGVKHRVRIDYASTGTTSPSLGFVTAGGSPSLYPRYTNATKATARETTAATSETAISYDSLGGLPTAATMAAALPTRTVQGTGGGALERTATYDGLGRVATTVQPNGAATTREYYDGTGTNALPLTNPCGASGTQAGALRSVTGPDPATGAPARKQEFVYDAAGRLAGSRVESAWV